jgi:hypothetical protein
LPPTGGWFGNRAIELAGIIVDPTFQHKGTGIAIVREFIKEQTADHLTAYTRNPKLLRVLGGVARIGDVLARPSIELPYATEHDGISYHIDRYAPAGLYGSFDPADDDYNGQVLKHRAALLTNPNNALAVSVPLAQGEK